MRSKPANSRTAALVVVIISDVPGNSRERPRRGVQVAANVGNAGTVRFMSIRRVFCLQ